jgi:cyclophilin family peptidyl-prolyl cis-trans isomerase
MTIDTTKTYTATFKTEKGDVTVTLDPEAAPQAVNNFVFLAKDGFYNGSTFFRVVADESGTLHFVQGGDPTGTGRGSSGYEIPFEETEVAFTPGVLAVAKRDEASAPNDGSQFFFSLQDEPALEGRFTVFGRVTGGLEVLADLDPRDPQTMQDPPPGVRIESIEISES